MNKREQKKPRILVSVDTEAPAGENPVLNMIYGKVGNQFYGIDYLMDFFDLHMIKALFFVDFAEAWHYGKNKIIEVVQRICNRGHDVGVHLHPDHMLDPERRFLWEYTYEEQYGMISKCSELYKEIVGKKPVSFRAGRYGADNTTLSILHELGYRYDMSYFSKSRFCKIDLKTWNQMIRISNSQLIEVPVTTFRSFNSFFYSRNDQIDSGMIPSEFSRVLEGIIKNDSVDVVSMFVHSFQFLNWRRNPNAPSFNRKKYQRFCRNFETLDRYCCRYISEADLEKIVLIDENNVKELDLSKGFKPLLYFFIRAVSVLKDRFENNI